EEGCGKTKGWTPIVLLRYLLEAGILESVSIGEAIISLIKQTKGTYAGSDKCPLGHILTYYEGHQPQYTHMRASMLAYAHINLLEMLRRFGPNEVKGADTSKFQCPHKIPSCAMCGAGVFYSKEAVKEFAKEVKNTSRDVTKESEPKEEKIREIQPGQWRDKGEKIHGPDPNVVYWPKNRHWKSIKNITESTALSIRDPITRS
ncbi:14026_t:CDS:2, partial [Funneliformis geosporum]